MIRRSKLEIYLDVLWSIKNGTSKPTCIMYETNLSWKPLQQNLTYLASRGLIREINIGGMSKRDRQKNNLDGRTKKGYEITQKGENVVRYFNRANDFLKLTSAHE